jgi:PAS domain S-box-containing protein
VKDIFGYTVEEFKSGRVLYSGIVHPDDLLRVAQEVETNSAEPGRLHFSHEPYRIITKGGNIKWLDDRTYIRRDGQGCVTHYQGIVLDISIRKQMEEERQRLESVLRRSQKMEAIGTLAGGIAHNFNNALMGIQGRTSLMMIDKPQSHPDLVHLKGIEEYVQNAAELTKELLGFARGGKYEVRPANLNELIKYENRMFGQTRKEIRITGKFEENLWTVEVDQGQIRQVLLNLYVNAWQAMPAGGELYVQTENVTLDEDYVKPLEIAPGRYVKISVTDTGVGMDDKTQQKIFNPFFTTKGMGEGTGLGLSSVYGIVNNHSGFINVYSKIGVGTTFNIYLPASEKEVVEEKQTTGEIVKGEGTILLVDDEDMIIEVGEKLLKKLGYKVMVSKSGKEAIDVYGKNMNNIDLIVLDMIMSGMGGGDTYDQLKEINPAIKVLLSSGYSINGQAQEILDRGCNGFIQKPFNMKELSKKIEGILDQE